MRKKTGKFMTMLLAVCMTAAAMTGCGGNAAGTAATAQTETAAETTAYQSVSMQVAALKGPTAIGLVKLMQEAQDQTSANAYQFTVAATADEFSADLIKGNIQAAAVPCNLAATLYNKSNGKIKVLGINTLNVLYVLDTGNSVNSVEDLRGRTIYTTGKGTTPEYTLRYLLQSAGIDPDKDVDIEFKSEATEVAALMADAGDEVVAMLPQPYVTTVQMSNSNVRIALDVNKEWSARNGADSSVVTGVIVVNTAFYEKNPAAVQKFAEEYQNSVSYVNQNTDAAADLVEQFGIFKAAVAKKAIPYCNITYIGGTEMKKKISSYLQVLYDQNPDAVGGSMPGDDFYITD